MCSIGTEGEEFVTKKSFCLVWTAASVRSGAERCFKGCLNLCICYVWFGLSCLLNKILFKSSADGKVRHAVRGVIT